MSVSRIFATFSCLLALAFAAPAARAGDILPGSAATFAAAVPGHARLNWGTALKTFLLDARVGDDGKIAATKAAPIRRLDASDEDSLPDTLAVDWLSARDVVVGGQPRLLILAEIDAGGSGMLGIALLALIDPAAEPKLLDLVDVADDRENYLDKSPALKIARDSDLVFISSAHLDAGADYAIRKALFVDHDRFGLIASVAFVSLTVCGYERRQSADFFVRPRPGAEFADLAVIVTERGKLIAEKCDPPPSWKPSLKTWRATFRWDPTKRAFATDSKALDVLAKHNADGL